MARVFLVPPGSFHIPVCASKLTRRSFGSVNAGNFLYDGSGARQNSQQPQQIPQRVQEKVWEAVRSVLRIFLVIFIPAPIGFLCHAIVFTMYDAIRSD